jgi:hypothetical protein
MRNVYDFPSSTPPGVRLIETVEVGLGKTEAGARKKQREGDA